MAEEAPKQEEDAKAADNVDESNDAQPGSEASNKEAQAEDAKPAEPGAQAPKEENEDAKGAEQEEVKQDEDASAKIAAVNFSGHWVLKSSSKSIDEYYKSEGWNYMMRKLAPMIPIHQIIKQDGDNFSVNVIVGPNGKFANETSTTVIGGDQEFEYKDKDGVLRGKTVWNEDKTQLMSESYRVDDKTRTYKEVRAFSTTSDKKMIVTTTNEKGKTLVQNFELQEAQK
eukprot:CAMPEP_0197036128 /NCGR_PEP_ID=MMETSP1384-20130603/13731_1 /TAXON_ID=29189 /ORGANISM="Ammonia sp." /LENGTH=226 /DNA_ID=CAMNT_0042466265 /DNA_START=45 /DNA_END=725 /DNA_ORIENTATION=-